MIKLLIFLAVVAVLAGECAFLVHYLPKVFVFWGANPHSVSVRQGKWFGTILLMLFTVYIWRIYGVVVLHIVLIAMILSLIGWIIRKLTHKDGRGLRFVTDSGVLPVVLTALVMLYGFYNMSHCVRTDYTLTTEKDLSQTYTIALVADVHFGTCVDGEALAKVADEIAAIEPDVLLLDGDIVDESTTEAGIDTCFEILGDIPTTYGTFYTFGNHDNMAGVGKYNEQAPTDQYLVDAIEENEITILEDEKVTLGDDLVLIGRKDYSVSLRNTGETRATIEELTADVDLDQYIIVADHQPKEYDENAAAGVDLVVSGHTHGGQIWPTGIFSQWLGINELNYGIKTIGNFNGIVTAGVGGWGYPIRTAYSSEYVVITVMAQ